MADSLLGRRPCYDSRINGKSEISKLKHIFPSYSITFQIASSKIAFKPFKIIIKKHKMIYSLLARKTLIIYQVQNSSDPVRTDESRKHSLIHHQGPESRKHLKKDPPSNQQL